MFYKAFFLVHILKCKSEQKSVEIGLSAFFFQTIGNILAIPKGNGACNDEGYDLQLIDFEYSAYNYR